MVSAKIEEAQFDGATNTCLFFLARQSIYKFSALMLLERGPNVFSDLQRQGNQEADLTSRRLQHLEKLLDKQAFMEDTVLRNMQPLKHDETI